MPKHLCAFGDWRLNFGPFYGWNIVEFEIRFCYRATRTSQSSHQTQKAALKESLRWTSYHLQSSTNTNAKFKKISCLLCWTVFEGLWGSFTLYSQRTDWLSFMFGKQFTPITVSTDPVLPLRLPGIVPAALVILKMKVALIHSLPIVTYYRNS